MNALTIRAHIERFRIWLYWCKLRDIVMKWYFRLQVRKGVAVLENLDAMLMHAGHDRHERRAFWRELTKSKAARELLFERLKK